VSSGIPSRLPFPSPRLFANRVANNPGYPPTRAVSAGESGMPYTDLREFITALDHASRLPKYGSKMGVDATRKWPEEGFTRPWPDQILMDPRIKELVDRRWAEYGLD